MTLPQRLWDPVVQLDLRSEADLLLTPTALREHTLDRLDRAGLPEPDDHRFLVVDTPAGLLAHEQVYEHIVGYRAVGEVRVLCLLVGELPVPADGAADPERGGTERVLARPAVLRSNGSGLLWAGDLRSARTAAARTAPDDPDALAVLVGLLVVPELFDAVLDAVGAVPDAVAAPGVRLLEQSLSEKARDRAWREALRRFAGQAAETALPGSGSHPSDLPKPLADLTVGLLEEGRQYRSQGEPADRAYRRCADALRSARATLSGLALTRGLFSPATRIALAAVMEEAHTGLDEYRTLARTALSGDTGTSGPQSGPDTAARLARFGLRVPPSDGVGEHLGEGLRQLAERLLREGMPLHAVAARFTQLSSDVEPMPGSTLLPRLDEFSPEQVRKRVEGSRRRTAATPAWRALSTGAAALLGGLWAWPLVLLALVVPVLVLVGTVMAVYRLPGSLTARSAVRRLGGAACVGAALGAAAGVLSRPPAWAGATGMLLALVGTVALVLSSWKSTAYGWGEELGPAAVQDALEGVDRLLAQAVLECWAAEQRITCADAARGAAAVLRATARAAEDEASRPLGTAAGGTAGAAPPRVDTAADDDWLSGSSLSPADLPEQGDGAEGDVDWAEEFAWGRAARQDDLSPRDRMPFEPTGPEPPTGRAGRSEPVEPVEPVVSGRAAAAPPQWPTAAEPPRWLEREAGQGGPELTATLAGDLSDAAVFVLGPYLAALEGGSFGVQAQEQVAAAVSRVLEVARTHLRLNGVVPPPPFAAAHRARPGSASLLGVSPLRIAEATGPGTARQQVTQLCTPEQATLLNRDPSKAVWVRFAPQVVQEEATATGRESDPAGADRAVWLSSGRYAGLLRLVPLRSGAVRNVRARQRPRRTEEEW